jgi:hypothetical protein
MAIDEFGKVRVRSIEFAIANSANGRRDLVIDIEVRGDRVVGKGLWFRLK